jgi:hypothetical protein
MAQDDIGRAAGCQGGRRASAGALAPSGNSVAATYPGVCGSRVGGGVRAGRGAAGGVWAIAGCMPAIRLIKNAMRRSFVFMEFGLFLRYVKGLGSAIKSARGIYH